MMVAKVLLSILSICLLLGCSGGPEAVSQPPNVILVMTDDQGYGDVGAHGNTMIQTPNLDKLWAESVRLTNFHVGPTCAPTRAALQTGRYCNRTGVWHTVMGRSLLRKDEVTLGNVFSDNGYKTGIFGKWHLGDNYPFRPQDHGYQEVLIHGGGGVAQMPDYWNNDYFNDTYFHNGKPEKYEGFCTDVWFDGAIDFITGNKDKPFFAYIVTNAPHGPFNTTEEYAKLYRDNPDIPNPNFYAMITNIDGNMERLDKVLVEKGLRDNTILIFMTDNGTAAGWRDGKGFNAGMRGTKGSEYDGGHRVPFFIRWPAGNIGGGKDVNRLTAHVDVMPTLAALCEIPTPLGVDLDGTNITSLLQGNTQSWPDRKLITDSQRIENPEKWRKSAVMTDRWRLVNGKELYDMPADPGQENDIADANPLMVKELRQSYEEWWASVSERFDEYCPIIVGSDEQNPTRLNSHDWHDANPVPWHMGHIRNAVKSNGFWMIDVAQAGTYEMSLRRWPIEENAPLNAAISGTDNPRDGRVYQSGMYTETGYKPGKAVKITGARLKVGEQDLTMDVAPDDIAATFTMQLQPGETRMEAWFSDDTGDEWGAFYVYVTRK
jgi:arylsulfatase A-like enzyme